MSSTGHFHFARISLIILPLAHKLKSIDYVNYSVVKETLISFSLLCVAKPVF